MLINGIVGSRTAAPSACCGVVQHPVLHQHVLQHIRGGARHATQCGRVEAVSKDSSRVSTKSLAASGGLNRDVSLGHKWAMVADSAADIVRTRQDHARTPPTRGLSAGRTHQLVDKSGRPIKHRDDGDSFLSDLLYNYYLWRQDTVQDLQLFLVVWGIVLLTGCAALHTITRMAASQANQGQPPGALVNAAAAGGLDLGDLEVKAQEGLWADMYNTLIMAMGQGFPGLELGAAVQAFAIIMSFAGLVAFALGLALIEQIVLEAKDSNVSRGSKVLEVGHYLILAWCAGQKDLELVVQTVRQVCHAYRQEGGTTVVVLSERDKLVMEDLFRRALPEADRHCSRLVFRKGDPLMPDDLELVAARRAGAVVIVSDASRPPEEADAQVVRCSVLLDELGHDGDGNIGHVVAEVRTDEAIAMLRYSCSRRVVAVPTAQITARKVSRLVRRPFCSWTDKRLFNFESNSSVFVGQFPELVGCRFGELPFRFVDGDVYGVVHTDTGRVAMMLPLDYRIRPNDQLIICRPTNTSTENYKPLPVTMSVAELEALLESDTASSSSRGSSSGSSSSSSSGSGSISPSPSQAAPFSAPRHLDDDQASTSEHPAHHHRDHDHHPHHDYDHHQQQQQQQQQPGQVLWGGSMAAETSAACHLPSSPSPAAFEGGDDGIDVGGADGQEGGDSHGDDDAMGGTESGTLDSFGSPVSSMFIDYTPAGYVHHLSDKTPERLLIVGWAGEEYMESILQELDQGSLCLPSSVASEVVLVNSHDMTTRLEELRETLQLEQIRVSHVRANPLRVSELRRVQLAKFTSAIVLCDVMWRNPTEDDNATDLAVNKRSLLRLDALIMLVQLNIRKCLADDGLPPINIVCEKLSSRGLTRFDDDLRLPLGANINFTSSAARTLAMVAYAPTSLLILVHLGDLATRRIVDASKYTGVGESVSWWEVISRAQDADGIPIGYYTIPHTADERVEVVVDPQGVEQRSRKRVWNTGDGRVKFIILVRSEEPSRLA